jgi:hypothetical protein
MKMNMKRKAVVLGAWLVVLFWAGDAVAFYNPSTGRWLSRDPIEEDGGYNVYAFTANNPISSFDLLGRLTSRVEVVMGSWIGMYHNAGTWSQPSWAGSGVAYAQGSTAYSRVDLDNRPSLWDPWYDSIYCNTVDWVHPDNPELTTGNAGSIWAFIRDECGGRFSISGLFSVTVGGWGRAPNYATANFYTHTIPSKTLLHLDATPQLPNVSAWLLFAETVDIPPNQWVMVAKYDLTLRFNSPGLSHGFGEGLLDIYDISKVK